MEENRVKESCQGLRRSSRIKRIRVLQNEEEARTNSIDTIGHTFQEDTKSSPVKVNQFTQLFQRNMIYILLKVSKNTLYCIYCHHHQS